MVERTIPPNAPLRSGKLGVAAGLVFLFACLTGMAPPSFAQGDLQEQVGRFRTQAATQERLDLGSSILARLVDEPDDVLEAEVRLALGIDLVGFERFAEAREHLVFALALARRIEDSTSLAHSAWELGVVAFRLGEFASGIEWAAEGADAAEAIERLDLLWRCTNIKGLIEERSGDYPAALDSFARGLEAAEKAGDLGGTATLHGNIGIALMNLGDLERARDSFLRARELQVTSGSPSGLPSTVANLGDVSFLLEDLDAAYEFHVEALRLREELGSEVELALSYHSLGAIHYQRGEYRPALGRFEQALGLRQRLGLIPEQAATLAAMARVYAALDEDDEAAQAVQKSLEITDDLDMLGRQLGILQSLAVVLEKQGNHAEALEAYQDFWALEREQRSRETREQYARFEAELDSREKERRIAALTLEGELRDLALDKHRLTRNFLLVGSLLLVVVALAGWSAWAVLRRTNRALTLANVAVRQHSEDLEAASERITRLEGLLPICAQCKSIRDEAGAWHAIEGYFADRAQVSFTHGLCPSCVDDYRSEARLAPPLPKAEEPGSRESRT